MTEEFEQLIFDKGVLWQKTKNFLDEHTDKATNTISAQDAEIFESMMKELDFMDKRIDELSRSASKPILNYPGEMMAEVKNSFNRFGVSDKDYSAKFFAQVRNGFKNAYGYLQEANPAQGGFLVPSEWHDELIVTLQNENVLRTLSRTITTATEHKICIQATAPTADFVSEGQAITPSTETFEQKTLSAYKLAACISVSNELLADSYYDIEEHLQSEFGKAIAAKEEESFLVGTGVNQPTGILTTAASDVTMVQETVGTNIDADDIIKLVYSLKSPYRRNAVFLMNDSTLAAIRRLKDGTQNYIWQPSLTENEPDRLFGFRVYTSEYMPPIASGELCVLFGDFTRLIIGQRGEMTFQPLRELHALQGLTTYLMTERIDCVLSDTQAIRALKIK